MGKRRSPEKAITWTFRNATQPYFFGPENLFTPSCQRLTSERLTIEPLKKFPLVVSCIW